MAFVTALIIARPAWFQLKIERIRSMDVTSRKILEMMYALAHKVTCPMDALRIGTYTLYLAWRFTHCAELTQHVADRIYSAVTSTHARYHPTIIGIYTDQLVVASMGTDLTNVLKTLKRGGVKNTQWWADALDA
jgi:hypothetical protein